MVKEFAEFTRTVTPMAFANDLSRLDIEGGEEGRGTVTPVLMGASLELPRPHRQHGRSTIKGLNL